MTLTNYLQYKTKRHDWVDENWRIRNWTLDKTETDQRQRTEQCVTEKKIQTVIRTLDMQKVSSVLITPNQPPYTTKIILYNWTTQHYWQTRAKQRRDTRRSK